MKSKGFTLIELLIVVAIIAILAAIAVPNFLEAQTRAKVSRVKSDMRTLVTALESYAVDYNSYVPSRRWGGTAGETNRPGHFFRLSTPVAYLSNSAFLDPFEKGKIGSERYLRYYAFNRLGIVGINLNGDAEGGSANIRDYEDDPRFRSYFVASYGPDRQWSIVYPDPTGHRPNGVNMIDYYIQRATADEAPHIISFSYDPTNGTQSSGQLYRFGGSGEIIEEKAHYLGALKKFQTY